MKTGILIVVDQLTSIYNLDRLDKFYFKRCYYGKRMATTGSEKQIQ